MDVEARWLWPGVGLLHASSSSLGFYGGPWLSLRSFSQPDGLTQGKMRLARLSRPGVGVQG